jgi:hypothetical protein
MLLELLGRENEEIDGTRKRHESAHHRRHAVARLLLRALCDDSRGASNPRDWPMSAARDLTAARHSR